MLPQRLEQFTHPTQVLDHGHVRLVDVMGDDSSPVQAARVSYSKGTKSYREDRALIRYMMRNGHSSPFEMCSIKLHMKMPIFVARQFVRHRTASLNEVSARYSKLPGEWYVPDPDRVGGQDTVNKQGTAGHAVWEGQDFTNIVSATYKMMHADYDRAIELGGVSREVARLLMGVGQYTEWYWKIDLRNLFHCLKLRLHPHAQWEAQQYAAAIAEIVKVWVPDCWEAFADYVLHSTTFSHMEAEALRRLLAAADERLGGDMDFRGFLRRELTELGVPEDDIKGRANFMRALGVIE